MPLTARPDVLEFLPVPARSGHLGSRLTELIERPLDELHTLVATTWSARFSADARDAEPLVLPSHFLLRRHGESWQIVVYLNSTDLAAVVAARTNGRTLP